MTSAHRPGPTTSLAELELVPAVVAADDATLREVAGLMVASGVSAVLVGGAHSIITERDVVRAMARGVPCDEPASPYATADPLLVLDSSSVMEALGVMLDRGIRNIVVVSENPSS
ncbi:MAG TPA: CBS domain-containing protein, partial [Acidimicrobiia bacterium]|nr:CBS domain-containing protein [Acidimicrobiia bacterium]